MKAVVLSGYLLNLSDNFKTVCDFNTDVYVHTWKTTENKRWVNKLQRYRKYCNSISIEIEEPKFNKKLHSYFYSTWKVVNSIKDIDQYETILKFKPNLESETTQYKGSLEEYFYKAYIQSKPLLKGTTKEECLYGSIYYQTMDERMFSGYPLAFKKTFHILYKDLYREMVLLDSRLIKQYGEDYEGSIFWMEWFNNKGVKLIQDLNLKLPNNILNV